MPNRRQLKRDIHVKLNALIEDFAAHANKSSALREKVDTLVLELIDLKENLLFRINNLEGLETNQQIKAHFNEIQKDLSTKCKEIADKFNAMR